MEWLADHSIVQNIGLSTRKSATSCGYCKSILEGCFVHVRFIFKRLNRLGNDPDNPSDSPEDEATDDPNEKKSVCLG
jgi:hypothetical protein